MRINSLKLTFEAFTIFLWKEKKKSAINIYNFIFFSTSLAATVLYLEFGYGTQNVDSTYGTILGNPLVKTCTLSAWQILHFRKFSVIFVESHCASNMHLVLRLKLISYSNFVQFFAYNNADELKV